MKVRTTRAGTALGARLTAICWGALTLLALVTVSACSGGSSSTPTVPSPSVTISPTGSGPTPASDGTTSPGTPGVTSGTPVPHEATATVTETVTAPATSSTSAIPTAAPPTGGGGTAGLQDGLLFGLGAALILAGVGSIVYRRRLTRDR
ncbi:MAG: hypothetical protein ACRDNT_16370 [Streptosporangiaceae bacterium]